MISPYWQLQIDLDAQLIVYREVFDDCALVFWGETKWTHDDNGDIRVEGKTSKDSLVKVHLFKTGKRKVQIIKSSINREQEYSTFYLVIHKHGNSTISSAA